jgi:hypothetical protein
VGFHEGSIDWNGLAERCAKVRTDGRIVDPALRHESGILMHYLGYLTIDDLLHEPVVNTLDNTWVELDAGRVRIASLTDDHYVRDARWMQFEEMLCSRVQTAPELAARQPKWSEVGRSVCRLHFAIEQRLHVVPALAAQVEELLPQVMKEDAAADWDAWPVHRSATTHPGTDP